MQPIRTSLSPLGRILAIKQIPIDIMFKDKLARVEPVVKDLAAHDVAPDAPAVFVALVAQPVVAQDLGVKIVRLKGRVVHVALGPFEEEEAVVVYFFVAAVQPEEDCYVLVVVIVVELYKWGVSGLLWCTRPFHWVGCGAYLAGVEVEVFRVKFIALLEICHAHAVMPQLVHRCWALLKALE